MQRALAEVKATLRRQSWLLAATLGLLVAIVGILLVKG